MLKMEISPNVHWLSARPSNTYLCVDEDGLTLIDTGTPGRHVSILDAVTNIGFLSSDLVRILVTHADFDHAGSAATLQAETGAAVYAGPRTAELLRRGKAPKHLPWLLQFLADNFLGYTAVPAAAIKSCNDGDVLPVLGGLQVLFTPGHSPDHHSFFSPTAGVLFTGDALITSGNRLQSSRKRITADEGAARRSAIRLLQLSPAVIASGHGPPMTDHSTDELMALFDRLRQN
jgi:glyoxylase-like metal-dependent hydrolase (beta-lactamase superfamily II)